MDPAHVSAANGRPYANTTTDISGIKWRVCPLDDEPAKRGREYALGLLRRLDSTGDQPTGDQQNHLNDVATVVGELLANAAKATRDAPEPPPGVLPAVYLGVRATGRFTHILVRDAVPSEPKPCEPYEDPETGDWHGYGLGLVEACTAAWWTDMRAHDKTVHAVVPRPGITLTAGELEELRR